MKIKYALIVMVVLAGSSIQMRSSSNVFNSGTTGKLTSTAYSSGCIDTLAAAYAETGDFDSAIRFEQQAVAGVDKDELNRSIKDPERERAATQSAVASYQRHLAAYQRRQPWRSNLD